MRRWLSVRGPSTTGDCVGARPYPPLVTTLRARLDHLVSEVNDSVWDATYPAVSPPPALALLGSIRPLRRFGGAAAAAEARRIYANTPPGYVDVWLHAKAQERRMERLEVEASRRDVDVSSFASTRLAVPASWGRAQLDPPREGEQPDYGEADARRVALAAMRHEGLPQRLLGQHLLFCRYTYEATRHQPVWLGLFEHDGTPHLLVINADSDQLLQPLG